MRGFMKKTPGEAARKTHKDTDNFLVTVEVPQHPKWNPA
jgi:hypothetical protein